MHVLAGHAYFFLGDKIEENNGGTGMAKIIAVNRKYLTLVFSVVLVGLLGFAGVALWRTAQASASKATVTPEVKMLGVTIEPASFVKDLTYGSVTVKGAHVIASKTFDLIATVQNTTGEKLTNVPVELEISLVGDDKQKISKMGNLQSLDPGAAARIAFRNIKVLGDAEGKNAAQGLHQIILRVKPNPAGGTTQTTQATFRFTVDSTVKPPAKAPAQSPAPAKTSAVQSKS